jgi:transcription elongation factor GreB
VYRIVGVDESDPARGMVSWISPIARALVSRRAGERVTVKLPAGEKSLRVVKVEYT